MIDLILSHPWSCCMAYIVACFWVWALCAIAGQADDEAEKMGKLRRIK
jgi:hypothetical protein